MENFYKTKNTYQYQDGRIDWCRDCMNAYNKSRRQQMKTKEKEPDNVFRVENKNYVMTFE